MIMVDSRATNNFISTHTVQKLKLPFNSHEKFGDMLGNGERIKGARVCQGLVVEVQNIKITEDFLMLELGNTDMILGLQWLEKLGGIVVNWKEQVMKFQWGMSMIELRGDPSLGTSQVSLKAMMRTLRKEKQGLWVELNEMTQEKEGTSVTIPLFLEPVVQEYQDVFGDITVLPPSRSHDHSIHLREGTNPVSVRPDRYPQIQKDESRRWKERCCK